jgi:hypothetical protein
LVVDVLMGAIRISSCTAVLEEGYRLRVSGFSKET